MQGYYIAAKSVWLEEASGDGILSGVESHWIDLGKKVNNKPVVFVTCHFGDNAGGQDREERWGALAGVITVIRDIDDILSDEALEPSKMNLVKAKVGALDSDSARAVIKKAAAMNKSMRFRRF